MKTLVIHPKDKTTDFLKPIYHGLDFTVITGGCTKEDVEKAIDEHDRIIMMGHGTPQGLLAMGQFNGKPKLASRHVTKPSEAIRSGGKPVTKTAVKEFYAPSKSVLDDLPDAPDDGDDDWFDNRKVSSGYGYGNVYGSQNYGSYSSYNDLTTGYVIDDKTADRLRGKELVAIWCNADQYMEWNGLGGFYTGMFISDTSEARMIGTADTEQWQVDESNYGFAAVVRKHIQHNSNDVLHQGLLREYTPMAQHNAVAKYNVKRMFCHANDKAEVVTI